MPVVGLARILGRFVAGKTSLTHKLGSGSLSDIPYTDAERGRTQAP